jgi:hypothetical protein
MSKDFYTRFNIPTDVAGARRRFMNRVIDRIDDILFSNGVPSDTRYRAERHIALKLGTRYEPQKPISDYFDGDFHKTLQALEAVYEFMGQTQRAREQLDGYVRQLMELCEVDIEVRWRDGKFYPAGAAELDKALVNDVLMWLREPQYSEVRAALENALNHLSGSLANEALRKDVITDAYEALESLSKIVLGSDKGDLSKNREQFLSKISAPAESRDLLKSYIEFGCEYRHGPGSRPRPTPSEADTEFFVYQTGAFIRRAVRGLNQSK